MTKDRFGVSKYAAKEIIQSDQKNTSRKQCTCYHEFQDKLYGVSIRVHNRRGHGGWRCTVCGSVKN